MSNNYEMMNRAHNVLDNYGSEKSDFESMVSIGINPDDIKDTGIKNHLTAYADAIHEMDIAGLKTAYHVSCIKDLLESNTSGLETDYVKFCNKTLHVKKAQAYNMLLAGKMVVMLYNPKTENERAEIIKYNNDEKVISEKERRKPKLKKVPDRQKIYVDIITYNLIQTKYGEDDKQKVYDECKKRKLFGQTQLVILGRLSKKYDLSIDVLSELLDSGKILPSMSVKAINTYIDGSYTAVTTNDSNDSNDSNDKAQLVFDRDEIEKVKDIVSDMIENMNEIKPDEMKIGLKQIMDILTKQPE